jgi:hypothetical protein
MGPSLQKLLEIGGKPFLAKGIDSSVEAIDRLGEIGISIKDVLRQRNGFFCFESAFRFFPSVTVEASWGHDGAGFAAQTRRPRNLRAGLRVQTPWHA